jgi:anaerobic selenocysteine-containing dehydrogenase
LVIADPPRHRFADLATLHLPITSGTDTYLKMSLVNILIENGWTDEAFTRKYTSGYNRLCDAAKKPEMVTQQSQEHIFCGPCRMLRLITSSVPKHSGPVYR